MANPHRTEKVVAGLSPTFGRIAIGDEMILRMTAARAAPSPELERSTKPRWPLRAEDLRARRQGPGILKKIKNLVH